MNEALQVYGKPDCADYARTRALLAELDVRFVFHDVTATQEAADTALSLAGTSRSPVLVFPSGAVLVEPDDEEIRRALL